MLLYKFIITFVSLNPGCRPLSEYYYVMTRMRRYCFLLITMLFGTLAGWAQVDLGEVNTGGDVIVYDGIDVSSYQKDIDWASTARDQNIQFVYVKATEGATYQSRHYRYNIENARKVGIKVGSYHFLRTTTSIQRQFENFIRTVDKNEQDLVPMIDVEVRRGWTNQQMRDSVKLFADLLEDHYGCRPLIYTSSSFFNNILGTSFASYPLFIARYAKSEPKLNGAKWTLWQFSDKGRIRGIDAYVDLCRFNKGCGLKDILINKNQHARKRRSVTDDVDRSNKRPDHVSVGSGEVKEKPVMSKRQQRELKEKEEKERKAKERAERMAREEARHKAEQAEKQREKEERIRKEEQKRLAKERKEKQERERKQQQELQERTQREQAKKQRELQEQQAKQERKAQARQARQQREQAKQAEAERAQQAKQSKQQQQQAQRKLQQTQRQNLQTTQRNDSIRNASQQGHKKNKSSADND